MFDKKKFAEILIKINETYDTMTEFAEKSKVNRTYLSQYINQKLDTPPSPKVLMKIANHSNKITSYEELMLVCGYLKKSMSIDENIKKLFNKNISSLKNLKLNKQFIISMYNSIAKRPNDDGTFDKLLFKFPLQERNQILKVYNKILTEVDELLSNSLNNVAISVKYNIENIQSHFYLCPVYGQIPAGEPNWAEECIEGYLPIDPNLMNIISPEECYFLKVNGESMNKVISNGAYALIRKTDWVENGEIAVILVNGYDATLKKFTKKGDVVVLEPMSNDPSFQTQIYDKNTPIKIIGKYIGKFEMKN